MSLFVVMLSSVSALAFVTDNPPSPLITPPNQELATTQSQRLNQRELAYKTQLAALSLPKIAAKCKSAQTLLAKLQTQDTAAFNSRLSVYRNLTSQLSKDVSRLKNQGVTPTGLNTAANNFYTAINTMLSDQTHYKAALDDAAGIDCVNNPTGFEASLLDARNWRAQMGTDAATIKSDVKPVVTALAAAKQEITSTGVSQ